MAVTHAVAGRPLRAREPSSRSAKSVGLTMGAVPSIRGCQFSSPAFRPVHGVPETMAVRLKPTVAARQGTMSSVYSSVAISGSAIAVVIVAVSALIKKLDEIRTTARWS